MLLERPVTAAPVQRPRGRYRYPGDIVRLVGSGALFVLLFLTVLIAPARLIGADARMISVLDPGTSSFRLVVGMAQGLVVVAAMVTGFAVLRRRRYRLAISLSVTGAIASIVYLAVDRVAGGVAPAALRAATAADSWIATAGFPSAAVVAAAAAMSIGIEPWLPRAWQRAARAMLLLGGVLLLVVGTVLPFELALALLAGTTVGLGLLVALGVPDGRLDAPAVAAALAVAGMPSLAVTDADVASNGSRPFVATARDGRQFFVKVLGAQQRSADLLYRSYRYARLRGLGDARPAASLKQSVEHQALVSVMAERSGVHVPHVEQVSEASEGSVLLVMEAVEGRSLDGVEPARVTDDVMTRTWEEVDRLHHARIAHRSLRSGNVMLDDVSQPWIVDFSFSELDASDRQRAVDVAELLASFAAITGPDRAVSAAAGVLGAKGVGSALPFLQPLALSAATRRAIAGPEKLLGRVRTAAAAVSGDPADDLAKVQRVRLQTIVMIAVASGAFYFVLPQLASAGESWRAFKSASWGWLVLVIAMSAVTYIGAGTAMLGAIKDRLAFGRTVLCQLASSFVNRVTPANIGGVALNVRYLVRSGAEPGTAIAGVGLNSLAGGIVHVLLIVVFFVWSGSSLARTFKIPASSTLLIGVAAAIAVASGVLFSRWGRRRLLEPVRRALRSSVVNLRDVSKSPKKLALLFGGSMLVTLAYITAFGGAIRAFDGGLSIATVGAVYLGASALAAAAPTPGNLGAIEATMVAGLTGVGMPAGPAVATVLTYRVATYWIPILPGWLAWQIVQRRGYV